MISSDAPPPRNRIEEVDQLLEQIGGLAQHLTPRELRLVLRICRRAHWTTKKYAQLDPPNTFDRVADVLLTLDPDEPAPARKP